MSTQNTEDQELTNIRYKPRARDDAWIRAFMQRASFGMLGTAWGSQPFVTPTLFVYDETAHAIYFHSAIKGRMRLNIDDNPQVCFTLAEMGRLLPAKSAKEFDMEYSSVMIFGEACVVEDPGEALRALDLLMQRYAPHLQPGRDYRAITGDELKITTVYRLDIKAWSGKENQAPQDHPGAFIFGQGSGG
jgi:nitroimidazol reductase NimA-like FMN-containing flavoprotein (pyridoxamine 5'-phosphate oxidase superfamily)